MGRRERERGVDSIISNFMAAFNGNTINVWRRVSGGCEEGEKSEDGKMAVNALFYRSIDGGKEKEKDSPNRLHFELSAPHKTKLESRAP